MLRAPFQKSLVSYRLPFSTLSFVVRTDELTEVFAVGKVEGDVVGVEPLLEAFEFPFKDVKNNAEVTGNGDQIITPIKFRLC